MNAPAAAFRRTGRSWEPGRSRSDSITLYFCRVFPHLLHLHCPFLHVQSPGPSHLHFSASCSGCFAVASFSFASAGAFTAAAWASHGRAGAGTARRSATAPPASHAVIEPVRAIAIPSLSLRKPRAEYPSSPWRDNHGGGRATVV